LNEYSVRLQLSKDRSTRSGFFLNEFNTKIAPYIQRRLVVLTKEQFEIFVNSRKGDFRFNAARNRVLRALRTAVADYLNANKTSTDDEAKTTAVQTKILEALDAEIYKKDLAKEFGLNADDRARISQQFIPDLVAAHEDLLQARELLQAAIDDLNKKWLVTFVYTNHRSQTGSDYSEFKTAFERNITGPLKFTANIGGSVYHKPDPTKNQESFRDFAAAFAFEFSATPSYLKDTADLSKITYSFNGRYQRVQENQGIPMKKADLAVFQGKVSIPLSNGVSIPLSVTYANSTDLIKESHVRGNFGISFDLDKFTALAKKVLKP